MVVVTDLGPPEEGIKATQPNVEVYLSNRSLGVGTLYVSEARVSWVGVQSKGFSLEYPHIAVHAVCRDLTQFHQECLYLMIDVRLMDQEATPTSSSAGSDMEDNEDESEGGMTEIRFVPDDKNCLDRLFQAMNECAALHPDTDDSDAEEDEGEGEEEEEGMYDDAEEGEGGGHAPGQNGDNGEAMDAD
eukprot:TRINITY_DN7905_c0_g1_i2.p1 TRINITY_DN7905_c0_g1~~TRINITY_DN7905_c0_g1_i2.p1  ORF type:complete len:188 (+),score=50.85 TRINITY_DN7905_c0_g1_i2:58-621(+)